jgi:hypothetical protein
MFNSCQEQKISSDTLFYIFSEAYRFNISFIHNCNKTSHPIVVKEKTITLKKYIHLKQPTMHKHERSPEMIKLFHSVTYYNIAKYYQQPGAYIICSYINGKAKRILTLNGYDESGSLYIGGTKNLCIRVERARRSLTDNYSLHPLGRIYQFSPNLKKRYPIDSLHVCLIPAENGLQKESSKKNDYKMDFGQLPIFNRN